MDHSSMTSYIQALRQRLPDSSLSGMGQMSTNELLRTYESCREHQCDIVVIDPKAELYDPPPRWRGDR